MPSQIKELGKFKFLLFFVAIILIAGLIYFVYLNEKKQELSVPTDKNPEVINPSVLTQEAIDNLTINKDSNYTPQPLSPEAIDNLTINKDPNYTPQPLSPEAIKNLTVK